MRLGQFNDYLSKSAHIFVSKLRIFDERGTETTRDFKNLIKNSKLLQTCTTQMRSIITVRSGTIAVNLAICYKKIEITLAMFHIFSFIVVTYV